MLRRVLASLFALAAAPPQPAAPPSAAADIKDGYWVSVELLGTPASRTTATEALSQGLSPRSPRDGLLPGEALGHAPDIHTAMRWVTTHAFERTAELDEVTLASDLRTGPAPVPGAGLRRKFGVVLRKFTLSGATVHGDRRVIDWPADPTIVLPPEAKWQSGDLIPTAAPLFAAPGASVPPSRERYAMARREGSLYVLGTLDRCRPRGSTQTCLRWAQVVVRDGDDFVAGYLPAFQVSLRSAWIPDTSTLPRATLIRSGLQGDEAVWELLVRTEPGVLHRTTVRAPSSGARFPAATLRLDGGAAIVAVSGAAEQRFPLDASLDVRPKD